MTEKKYDLGDRTFKFSQELLSFCSRVPKSQISNPIISQLIRSGTSIGANYAEADAASTKKDFLNKLAISRKEINETKYWLRLIAEIVQREEETLIKLSREVQELNLIFAAIIRNGKIKND